MRSRFFRNSVLLLVFVLSCIYCLTPISAAYAFDSESTLSFITESVESFVSGLLEEDDTYSSFRNANLMYMYPLYNSTASNIIAHYYELVTVRMVGYLIADSETGTVLEFSATGCSPYANIQASNSLQNSTECKRVYCFWDYGVVNGNNVVFQNSGTRSLFELSALNQSIHIFDARTYFVTTNLALNSARSVSGFEYYLQNDRNCVIAAMAHIITFWGGSCPNLCNVMNQATFNSLMDTLTTYATQNGGVGVNASIPPTFQAYVNGISSSSYSYTVSA